MPLMLKIFNIHHNFLNDIYKIVNLEYDKKYSTVEKTINSLDFENIYLNLVEQLKSLNDLVDDVNEFLA